MVHDGLPAVMNAAAPGASGASIKRSLLLACAGAGLVAMSACSPMSPCETSFRGSCVPGPPVPKPFEFMRPPEATPGAAGAGTMSGAAAAGMSAPAGTPASAAPAVPYGDPATFADVDDKQCRSYGLTFGSHDYADCRIQLSAQHRGLNPTTGVAPATSGGRPSPQ